MVSSFKVHHPQYVCYRRGVKWGWQLSPAGGSDEVHGQLIAIYGNLNPGSVIFDFSIINLITCKSVQKYQSSKCQLPKVVRFQWEIGECISISSKLPAMEGMNNAPLIYAPEQQNTDEYSHMCAGQWKCVTVLSLLEFRF
jgi:hypothetical protein